MQRSVCAFDERMKTLDLIEERHRGNNETEQKHMFPIIYQLMASVTMNNLLCSFSLSSSIILTHFERTMFVQIMQHYAV